MNVSACNRTKLIISHVRETAFGVLHERDRVDPQHMHRKRQASQYIISHATAGIANDQCLTQVQSQRSEYVNSSVHARHYREVLLWIPRFRSLVNCCVRRIRFEELFDSIHVMSLGRTFQPGSVGPLTLRPGARSSTDRASDFGSDGWGFESLRARRTDPLSAPVK